MPRLLLFTAISVLLAGCAAGGYSRSDSYSDGASTGTRYSDPYRSETGSQYDWSRPRYNDRYWPPVDLNSPFPPQIMDGGGKGR
jgi:hypothetical protein